MKVAIQGVRGAFHEVAAREFFAGKEIEPVERLTFNDVMESVLGFESDYGIMAIENTISGTIHANLKLLRQYDVKICGEVSLRIKQNLVALPGTKLEDIQEVRSHYMAINQTRQFFRKYPDIRLVESESTAISMRQIAEKQIANIGAIGGEYAAQMYGLEIIQSGIETNKKNYTRFLIVQPNNGNRPANCDKASLSIILQNHPGSLSQILSIISFYGVDLTKIESSPIIGQPMHYMFYIDVRFAEYQKYCDMLTAIRPLLKELTVLGEYKAGEESWNAVMM
ncbi:MAG: prephenate dehydratase [Bacteroidales bacterium]|nr:prephenate dehydratase [Bacteroidales bacterium]